MAVKENEKVLAELIDFLHQADHSKLDFDLLRKILIGVFTLSEKLTLSAHQRAVLKMRITTRELLISKTVLFDGKYKSDLSLRDHVEKTREIIIEMINLCD